MFYASRDFIRFTTPLIADVEDCIRLATFKAELSHGKDAPELLEFWESVFRAAREGVKVKAIINYGNRFACVPKTNRLVMQKLREAGADCRYFPNNRCAHAKLLILDRAVGFMGSHNLSVASTAQNWELTTSIASGHNLNELIDIFDAFFSTLPKYKG